MRIFKAITPLFLACLLVVGGQGIRASRAETTTTSYHFWGLVTQGMDAGQILEGVLDVTPGGGGAVTAVLTMGDASTSNATGSMMGKAITLKFPMTGMGTLTGTGTKAGTGWVGSFTGPHAGDRGTWRAGMAVATINYAVTGSVTKGPSKGKSVIGDLTGVVEADGTVTGRYTDNSNVGPGITVKTYPVHGFYVNNNLAAAVVMGAAGSMNMMPGTMMAAMPTIMIVGHAATFFGQKALNGSLVGPKSGDSGVVSAVAQ